MFDILANILYNIEISQYFTYKFCPFQQAHFRVYNFYIFYKTLFD